MGLLPNITENIIKVQAAEIPIAQFATKDQLLSNFKMDGSVGSKLGRLKFGANGWTWFIAGAEDTNTLALLSTDYYGTSTFGVDSRYSRSSIKNILADKTLDGNTTYFSESEKALMKETTVSTLEYDQADTDEKRTVTGKLYLPDAFDRYSSNDTKIYVGTENNIAVNISYLTLANGFHAGGIWLRSPSGRSNEDVLMALSSTNVSPLNVQFGLYVVPAFHLDMSSVLFASAVPEASSEGSLPIQSSMTIRYASTALGNATISPARKSIVVRGTGERTYLVVQNAEGAWAKDVSNVSDTFRVLANDVTINGKTLSSFSDCKVWLEKTNPIERITTATMAVQEIGNKVVVTPGSNMTKADGSGEAVQTNLEGAMTNVVYKVDAGYYFPEDYTVSTTNGLTVTRNDFTQITVSGTPTADTTVTLVSPTKKSTQAAPTGLSDGINKIVGTTTEMEYASSVDAVTWATCSNSSTDASAGVWYVRYKETPTKEAGAPMAVTVTMPIPKYLVTIENDGNGTALANVNESEAGANISLTATANVGYEFKEWQVVSGGVTITNNSFVMPSNEVVVKAIFIEKKTEERKAYEILEGKDQTVILGHNTSPFIRVNADYSKFVSVAFDGTILSEGQYITQSGSTIITLKNEFIETLALGKHTITIQFTDGTAQTSLFIKKAESGTEDGKDDVPKTGENDNVVWLYVSALISGGVLVASNLKIRKIKFNKK